MSKKIVYEEFNLLQAALDIEDGLKITLQQHRNCNRCRCRWNAHSTVIDYFFQFFPELKEGHLYILQTPLFRVRNKKETIYCYSDEERKDDTEKIKTKTRNYPIQGIGRNIPDEFKNFIEKLFVWIQL
jgi:topoisomerase-4 subunit B